MKPFLLTVPFTLYTVPFILNGISSVLSFEEILGYGFTDHAAIHFVFQTKYVGLYSLYPNTEYCS